MHIITYEFTTYDGRWGEVAIDDYTGRIVCGVIGIGEETIPMEILDSDRVFDINHPNFRTISPKV